MASIGDLVVKITADTSEIDKAMDHIQYRLWWYRHSSKVLAGLCSALLLLGGAVGFLLGMQV